MTLVTRRICVECEQRKFLPARISAYRRKTEEDGVSECAFCHEMRYCKCYVIAIGGKQ